MCGGDPARVTQVYYLGIVTWGWALCVKAGTPTLQGLPSLQHIWDIFSEYAPPVCLVIMCLIYIGT